MKKWMLIALAAIPLFTGCGTLVKKHFNPAKNDTCWNTVRASMFVNHLASLGYPDGLSTNQHFEAIAPIGLFPSKQVKYPWTTPVFLNPKTETNVCFSYYIVIIAPDSDLMASNAWKRTITGYTLLPHPSKEIVKAANQKLKDDPDFADIAKIRKPNPQTTATREGVSAPRDPMTLGR